MIARARRGRSPDAAGEGGGTAAQMRGPADRLAGLRHFAAAGQRARTIRLLDRAQVGGCRQWPNAISRFEIIPSGSRRKRRPTRRPFRGSPAASGWAGEGHAKCPVLPPQTLRAFAIQDNGCEKLLLPMGLINNERQCRRPLTRTRQCRSWAHPFFRWRLMAPGEVRSTRKTAGNTSRSRQAWQLFQVATSWTSIAELNA